MTTQQFLNKILLRFRMQVVKMPRSAKVYGINWIEDVNRLNGDRAIQEIFDIGANRGQTTKRLATEFPAARVRAFEPTPESFTVLQGKMREYSNVECYNSAFGSENKKAEFFVRDHHESNSFLNMTAEAEKAFPATGKIIVDVQTLDHYADDKKINVIDVVKINAEGFDYQILQGGRNLFQGKRIRFVFVEVMFQPLFQGEANLGQFLEFMGSVGYGLVGLYESGYDEKSAVRHSNALFVAK